MILYNQDGRDLSQLLCLSSNKDGRTGHVSIVDKRLTMRAHESLGLVTTLVYWYPLREILIVG